MDPSTYHHELETGSAAIVDALAASPAAGVPSCPGWDMAKLGLHLGLVYGWSGAQVRQRSQEPLDRSTLPRAPDGDARVGWLSEAAAAAVAALRAAGDDDPAGGWRDLLVTAGFWRRRLAHETAIHRFDATEALGRPFELDGDLAADGVDEVVDLFLPYAFPGPAPAGGGADAAGSSSRAPGPAGSSLRLVRTDGQGEWLLSADGTGSAVWRAAIDATGGEGDVVTVAAPAATLLLICWGRRRPAPSQVSGDTHVLDAWLQRFHW